MNVYIIWVNHSLQLDYPDFYPSNIEDKKEEFKSLIQELIKKYNIKVAAEEYSEDAIKTTFSWRILDIRLDDMAGNELGYPESSESMSTIKYLEELKEVKNIIKYSVLYNIANINKIMYLPCDPSKERRKELKIDEEYDENMKNEQRHFKIREKEWLSIIKPYIDEEILFVCGSRHLDSFGLMLKQWGINCEIIKTFNP